MYRERIKRLVESALEEYGGGATKKAVTWHLKHVYHLDLADAVDQPDKFVRALKDMYGDLESIIEESICEKISEEYGIGASNLSELAEKIKKA